MPVVFVSHATADSPIVDPFVDTILRLGCELRPVQIFYSSGGDTGVPSGTDLIGHVREQAGQAGPVIAIISPMFQARPVCIAELGAAWSRTGNLFPIAVPGMARTDMEGVLSGMTVRYLDDGAALDELHERIGEMTGRASRTTTWGSQRAKWLANVEAYAANLPLPESVSAEELQQVRDELAGVQKTLTESEAEVRELKTRIQRYEAAESAGDHSGLSKPLAALLRLETNLEDFRHRVRNGLDSAPPVFWRHLLARDVWDEYEETPGRTPRRHLHSRRRRVSSRGRDQ